MTFAEIRNSLARQSIKRQVRRELARELASYNTPAQRLDLEVMLEEYPAEQTSQVRAVLSRLA